MRVERPKIPSLIEVGSYVINVCYLIMRKKTLHPDGGSEVDVHLESGIRIRLKGAEAALFDRRLALFLLADDEDETGPGAVNPTVSRKRRRPGTAES